MMLNIVLYEPEIPPNTGNIIRLCSNTGCVLHLIEPLGFTIDDKKLRRAGLDYAEWTKVRVHESYEAFKQYTALTNLAADKQASTPHPKFYGCSTKGKHRYDTTCFQPDDYLLFGPETRGLPQVILDQLDQVLYLPMQAHSRSLNLSNSVAIFVYEAWRQQAFSGAAQQA